MLRNKKILIISPSLKVGGIERALTTLANYFVTQHIEVVFLSCLKGDRFYKLDKNIHVIEPNFGRDKGFANKSKFYPQLVQFIKVNCKALQPDAVLSFGDVFNPLVLLALKNQKAPIFISDRTSPDYQFKFPIPFLKKWLYPKSAGFIAQTTRAAEFKRKQFGDKLNIKIIPNAVKEVVVCNSKREKVILYVGRFAWEKAPQYLIHAFAELKYKHEWKLVMAGSGPMLEEMRQLARQLKIESQIDFLGNIKNVDELYAKASIYVLPSVIEGFPNSLCEAMSAGLPSVCFDTIPHEDIFIEPKMGVVCKKLESLALAEEIDYLIEHKDFREEMSVNALKINNHLNMERIGKQFINFMQLD